MEALIKSVEEVIQKEKWNYNYHKSLADESESRIERLTKELAELKDNISSVQKPIIE